MTTALASHIDSLDLPLEPGISPRAIRAVLKMMAKIANDAGEFRYGLRGSKLAGLTEYSLSVVRRAQRYLVAHGYVERLEVGGGRASTKWRIVVDKIAANLGSRHASSAATAHHQDRGDTAQDRDPKLYQEMNPARPRGESRPVFERPLCEHGFEAGLLPSGTHRCPLCRRQRTNPRRTYGAPPGRWTSKAGSLVRAS